MAAPTEKLQTLILAESMMTIFGEKWLVGQINSPDGKEPFPTDRYAILVMVHLHG